MSEYGTFSWDYYYINKKGKLVDKAGTQLIETDRKFTYVEEAEKWLNENNIRGNVIGFYEDLPKKKRKEKS